MGSNSDWKKDTNEMFHCTGEYHWVKQYSPALSMHICNKGIGWFWTIRARETKMSLHVYDDKKECMEECEKEALKMLTDALYELWNISI